MWIVDLRLGVGNGIQRRNAAAASRFCKNVTESASLASAEEDIENREAVESALGETSASEISIRSGSCGDEVEEVDCEVEVDADGDTEVELENDAKEL